MKIPFLETFGAAFSYYLNGGGGRVKTGSSVVGGIMIVGFGTKKKKEIINEWVNGRKTEKKEVKSKRE